MSNLQKQSTIKKENLSNAHYFQSILQEAYNMKLLSNSELEKIQLDSITLLSKRTQRYTGGESSSVKVETGQNILGSIYYSIGIYLKTFIDIDQCIQILKETPLSELCFIGRKLIEEEIDTAKKRLYLVQENSLQVKNEAYHATLQDGLGAFFLAYDPDFAAHDTPGSIDYPLAHDKMDLTGIEYIANYLKKIYWENEFCKQFDEYNIDCTLRGYDHQYKDLLINIFTIVLTNGLGCVLIGKDPLQLNISDFDRQLLEEKLECLPLDHLNTIIKNGLNQLCIQLDIYNPELQEYIFSNSYELSVRIKNALENGQLQSVFISHKEAPTSKLQFIDAQQMDDTSFRKIVEEIRDCRLVSDKINIIEREVHSMVDLVDILEGGCLFENEFEKIFQTLGDMELGLLRKQLSKEDIDLDLHYSEGERQWHRKLERYLDQLELSRKDKIKHFTESIDLE